MGKTMMLLLKPELLNLAESTHFFEFEEKRDRFQKVHEQGQAAVTEVNAETTPVVKDTNTTNLAKYSQGRPRQEI